MVVEAFKTAGSILNKSTQNKNERTELPIFSHFKWQIVILWRFKKNQVIYFDLKILFNEYL